MNPNLSLLEEDGRLLRREVLTLVVLGAVIGLGKLLVGGERLTVRILLGRMIVGAGLSSSAGAILIMFKELEPTALIGVASAIGILGQSVLEAAAQRFLGRAPAQSCNGEGH